MEFVVEFEAGNKVLRVSMDGIVTEQTLIELTAEVRRLFESQAPDVLLVDLSGVTGFEISTEVVRFSCTGTVTTSGRDRARHCCAARAHLRRHADVPVLR